MEIIWQNGIAGPALYKEQVFFMGVKHRGIRS